MDKTERGADRLNIDKILELLTEMNALDVVPLIRDELGVLHFTKHEEGE